MPATNRDRDATQGGNRRDPLADARAQGCQVGATVGLEETAGPEEAGNEDTFMLAP